MSSSIFSARSLARTVKINISNIHSLVLYTMGTPMLICSIMQSKLQANHETFPSKPVQKCGVLDSETTTSDVTLYPFLPIDADGSKNQLAQELLFKQSPLVSRPKSKTLLPKSTDFFDQAASLWSNSIKLLFSDPIRSS